MGAFEAAARTSVYPLVAARAAQQPASPALIQGEEQLDYSELIIRVDRYAAGLAQRGVHRGDRVGVLSENRIEYTLLQLACAKLGAIVACQNWRLSEPELDHCIRLVEPTLLVFSPRYAELAARLAGVLSLALITDIEMSGATACAAEPEDGFLIIYTSGTTGLPKAAMISHRAEIARMCALRLDLGIGPGDGYIAWAPMFHMGGTEHLLACLMSGGPGFVIDGFDADAIAEVLPHHRIGWLMLVPSTIEPLLARIRKGAIQPKGVSTVGCMADLVPTAEIAGITKALGAPYLNSFGSTETGMPPLSADLIPVGAEPSSFPKRLSILTELRLVGADGKDVEDGEVGEAWVRGPTVFSGYWNAEEANAASFRDGWFRMGDLMRKTSIGYEFAGRSKYLIKSGGENIYPAEIERVLLADSRVLDAIVVRKPNRRWGEVPVAVIARTDKTLDATEVERLCRASLAGYKRPREIVFVTLESLPRSASGKIIREDVERMIA